MVGVWVFFEFDFTVIPGTNCVRVRNPTHGSDCAKSLESHPRQWVDRSDAAYKQGDSAALLSPTHGKWVDCSGIAFYSIAPVNGLDADA